MSDSAVPNGYTEFLVRDARVVVLAAAANAVREAMAGGPLYHWAERSAGARALAGRCPAWAAMLPGGTEIVVRHSRHGGVLAPLTGDLFLPPTRAPRELHAAIRLARAGVPTSEVVAYAVYSAFGVFARADVATRRLVGADLPEAWRAARTEPEREALMRALTSLLGKMRDAGALHPDLNLKNILFCGATVQTTAFLLDVDRVEFREPHSHAATARNLTRLHESAAKWNREQGLGLDWQRYLRPVVQAVWKRTDP